MRGGFAGRRRFRPAGTPQGDAARRPMRELASGADRIEGKPQFMRKYIRRAPGQNAEGHLARRKAVDNFVKSTIPSTNQDHINPACGCGQRKFVRHGGSCRGRQVDFQSRLAQHGRGFANFALPPGRTPPRNRIIDEDSFFQVGILDLRLWIGASICRQARWASVAFNRKSKI